MIAMTEAPGRPPPAPTLQKDVEFLSFYLMVVVYALFFLWYSWVLFRYRKEIHCKDLITSRNGKVSQTALARLSGLIVASWLTIHMAITDLLDSGIGWACLTYLAGVELYSKWLSHKEGQQPQKPLTEG